MSEPFDKAQDKIIPAILPKNPDDLREKVSALSAEINFIHLDVLEEDVWIEFNKNFEVHLMVKEPEKIISRWIARGAKRIIVHESTPQILSYRDKVEIGLEIEMNEFLERELEQAQSVDFIHIMSIDNIGEQGHPFNPKVFGRIREVKEKFPKVTISVDGGVSKENYQELIAAGAERLIVGSHFKDLWNLLKKK
jgi:pentose-5-phosphate-3-epimerase